MVADGCSILSLGPPNVSLPHDFVTDGVGRGTGGLFTGENAIMAGLVLGMALAGVIVVAWVILVHRRLQATPGAEMVWRNSQVIVAPPP